MKQPGIAVGGILSLWIVSNSALAETWTQTQAPTKEWKCMASSADGSKLVALTPAEGAWTSTNWGNDWVSNALPSENWASVASSADGTRLAAAMAYPSIGPIYLSTDSGATWNPANVTNAYWASIASSADGQRLVADTSNGSGLGAVWTSTNGGLDLPSNSVPRTFHSFLSAASSADGSKLVIGTYGADLYKSANSGLTWVTNNVPPKMWQALASSADGTVLGAAVYNGPIYISTNSGVEWHTNNSPSELWRAIAILAGGNQFAPLGFHVFISTQSGVSRASNKISPPTKQPPPSPLF